MASIEVDYPLHGTHVPTSFTATGTFSGGTLADITCNLMRNSVTVATGVMSSPSAGNWVATFAGPLSPESYLTFAASIAGGSPDSDEEDKITVDSDVPIDLDLLPAVRSAAARTTIAITGRHRPHIAAITCVGFVYKSKTIERVAAVAIGGTNTPAPGKWNASLTYPTLAAGRKLGVLVVGFDLNGIVRGRCFRRKR
jgi:hypothetical protein